MDFDFDTAMPANREQMRWLALQAALAHMNGDKAKAERLLDDLCFIRDLILIGEKQEAEA